MSLICVVVVLATRRNARRLLVYAFKIHIDWCDRAPTSPPRFASSARGFTLVRANSDRHPPQCDRRAIDALLPTLP